MHDAAERFLESVIRAIRRPRSVCEIGSRNVNGSVRHLFPRVSYVGIDIREGDGVDIVADGATWTSDRCFDLVLCTETLEHATDPMALARNLVALCKRGGVILVTAAAMDREPHSAIDGGPLQEGEPYHNLMPEELQEAFSECRAVMIDERNDGDIYAMAVK